MVEVSVVASLLQWGTAEAQIKDPSVERTQSSKVLPFKSKVGLYIAMYATPTARDFFLANPEPLPSFSCVGCG